jgi:hypothetical protein
MRYVVVPENITPINYATGKPLVIGLGGKDGATGEPWTFHRYLSVVVFDDRKLGASRKHAKAVKKVHKLFKDASPGDVVAVEDWDWEQVKTVIDEPTTPQSGTLSAQFTEFMDAWCDAKEEAPKVEKLNGKPEPVALPDALVTERAEA